MAKPSAHRTPKPRPSRRNHENSLPSTPANENATIVLSEDEREHDGRALAETLRKQRGQGRELERKDTAVLQDCERSCTRANLRDRGEVGEDDPVLRSEVALGEIVEISSGEERGERDRGGEAGAGCEEGRGGDVVAAGERCGEMVGMSSQDGR